jgi:hypothetical protein
MRLEMQLIEEGMRQEAANRQAEKEIALEAARRKVDNDLSVSALQMKLIEYLPAIAEKMPHPKELKSVSIGGQRQPGRPDRRPDEGRRDDARGEDRVRLQSHGRPGGRSPGRSLFK